MEAVLNPTNGLENLKKLEKPPQIVGYVRQLLGLLSPQGKLAVQVLAHFHVHNQEKKHDFGDQDMLLMTRNSLEQQHSINDDDDTKKDDDIIQELSPNKSSFFKSIPKVNDENYDQDEPDNGGWGKEEEDSSDNVTQQMRSHEQLNSTNKQLYNVAEGRASEEFATRSRNHSSSLDLPNTSSSSSSSSSDLLSSPPPPPRPALDAASLRGQSLDGHLKTREETGESKGPLPTLPVLRRAFAAIAPIKEQELLDLLGRLAFYGLVNVHNDATNEELENHKVHEKISDDALVNNVSYYSLTYPLLQEMAADQLLQSQKLAIRRAIKNPRKITKRASM
jgi:hypothetical protein